MGRTQTWEVKEEVLQLNIELEKLLHDQMIFWQQRGKVAWMKDGDKNTSFFHAKATIRERVNTIKGLRDAMGNWVEEKTQMEGVVEGLFKTTDPSE